VKYATKLQREKRFHYSTITTYICYVKVPEQHMPLLKTAYYGSQLVAPINFVARPLTIHVYVNYKAVKSVLGGLPKVKTLKRVGDPPLATLLRGCPAV
jgi:hypothetical protein